MWKATTILDGGFLIAALVLPALAQQGQAAGADAHEWATVSGIVTDASGAVVARATVAMNSAEPGPSYSSATDASGAYRFSGLPSGRYSLKIESPGFRAYEKSVDLNATSNLQVTTTLAIANLGGVEVSAANMPPPVTLVSSPSPVLKQKKSGLRKLWCW